MIIFSEKHDYNELQSSLLKLKDKSYFMNSEEQSTLVS